MPWRRPSLLVHVLTLAGLAASARLGWSANERMVARPQGEDMTAGQSSDGDGPRTSQKIQTTAAARSAQYGFQNFNGDKLEVSYQIAESEFQPYNQSFGYTQEGMDELKSWRDRARKNALDMAVKQGKSQAQLDAAIAGVDKEYKLKQKQYLAEHGFRMDPGNTIVVDMPALVHRNAAMVKPLALTFERIAKERGYRSPDIVGAVLSMVQTALFYKQPDLVFKGKHTGGILPPITAVVVGWGDCDTKTGLLGSILSNWSQTRMVGVSVPGHYLMGVLMNPEKGDMFLEYQGLQYLLVEPAGPAWLPAGRVGEETSALLSSREGYKIEPFF